MVDTFPDFTSHPRLIVSSDLDLSGLYMVRDNVCEGDGRA